MNGVSLVPRRLQSSYSKVQLKSYCDLLGVPVQASEAKIKQAFYKKSIQHHPDKNPGSEESAKIFSEINEAYQALIFDRRYGDAGPTRHDFSNRWKYASRNQFRQWERVKPETQRSANSAWRDVHSVENEEARQRFKDSGDSSWFGRYYDSIVQEDLEHHKRQREKRTRSIGGGDSGCRLM